MFAITMKWLIILAILGGLLVGGVAFGYASALVKDEPIRSKAEIMDKIQKNAVSGFIYFNDDSLIGQIRSDEDRTLISVSEIPDKIIDAFLAIEDNDFKEHSGVNIRSFMRAAKQQLLNEPIQTGGSTITQQVTKLTFFSSEVSNSRKAKEILLALRLERYLSKDEILEAYLNKISFGNGSNGYYAYGIKTAAKGIFDADNLNQLNSAQAAYLAGLPQNPNSYSAFTGNGGFREVGFERAMTRQRHVLKRMLEENKLTPQEYEAAVQFDIKKSLAPTKKKAYSTYPFLMLEAERKAAEALIMRKNPELTVNDLRQDEYADLVHQTRDELRGGYKIYTTIDQTIYDAMQEIAQDPELYSPDHEEKGIEQIGSIMLNNKTSAIIAMIEGRDFYEEQLNHATQMIRQPGSAMKPIAAYLPALEAGYTQPGDIIDDVPYIMPDWTKGYHIPVNHNFRYHGLITARHALNQSYNIPALKLFNEEVGIEKAWEFSKSLGITTITDSDINALTGVIGGMAYGTSVEELTNAYTAIANKGQFNDAYLIRKIEDASGEIIYEHESNQTEVFSEQTAYLMTDMLRTVVSAGTGSRIKSAFKNYNNVPIVGKTGTTQIDHDIWFVGYSPDVTVGTWVGYDQPSPILTSEGANHRAKEIWSLVMDKAIELKPELFTTTEFEKPENIVSMTVSSVSGNLPSALNRQSNLLVTDIFNKAYIPVKEDDSLSEMKVVNYKNMNYIPLATTPEDMIRTKTVVRREQPISELMNRIEGILEGMSNNHRPKRRGVLMTVEDYYPQDMHLAAPTEADPRVDDGFPPAPPTGVELIKLDDSKVKITFTYISSADIVGYRLYRSFDGRPFVHTPSRNVLGGDDAVIIDGISSSYEHAYYLTAVDVAGNESSPSKIVSTNGNHDGILLPPFFTDDDKETEETENNEENEENGENNSPEDSDNNDEVSDTPEATMQPTSPTEVKASSTEEIVAVEITWTANPTSENINQYHIYYSEEQDGEYQKIGSSNTTRFQYVSLPIQGWYRVAAENNNGLSEPSQPTEYK